MLNLKFQRGFTLIEVVVVMSIFFVIVGTAVGIFISVISGQKRILSEQALLNQASYITEYMSKSLRMASKDLSGACLGEDYQGYNYLLTRYDSIEGAYRGIKFINQLDNNACDEFYFDNIDQENTFLKEIKNNGSAVSLTSDKVIVEYARFVINGKDSIQGSFEEDGIQPRVTISFGFKHKGDKNQPSVKIQTTVSQRDLNVK
jgi:prepilin-type N-terminal cleavage/methylation domain-containing protein